MIVIVFYVFLWIFVTCSCLFQLFYRYHFHLKRWIHNCFVLLLQLLESFNYRHFWPFYSDNENIFHFDHFLIKALYKFATSSLIIWWNRLLHRIGSQFFSRFENLNFAFVILISNVEFGIQFEMFSINVIVTIFFIFFNVAFKSLYSWQRIYLLPNCRR